MKHRVVDNDPRLHRGLVSSLNATWKEEHESQKNLSNNNNASSSQELSLEKLARSRPSVGTDAAAAAGETSFTNRRLHSNNIKEDRDHRVTFSKKIRLQNIHQAVKKVAAASGETSSSPSTTAKRRSSGVTSVLKHMFQDGSNKTKKASSSSKKAAGCGAVPPRLGEKKGDTAKGRGRSARSATFVADNSTTEETSARGDDDDEDVALWGKQSGGTSAVARGVVDPRTKPRVRSKSEGVVTRMRKRSAAQRKQRGTKRGSLSPRSPPAASRELVGGGGGTSQGLPKSSTTSGDDTATAVVHNKAIHDDSRTASQAYLNSLVAEAQAARELLAQAQDMERKLERDSSELFFTDKSERTRSTHTTNTSSSLSLAEIRHNREASAAVHLSSSTSGAPPTTTSGHVIPNASPTTTTSSRHLRNVRPQAPGESQRHRSKRMTKPMDDVAIQDGSASSHQSLLDPHNMDHSSADPDSPLHTSDSQLDYYSSHSTKASLPARHSDSDRATRMKKFGMDESTTNTRGGSTRLHRTHRETSTQQRTRRRDKGMSASDRTHSVRRARPTTLLESRPKAASASVHHHRSLSNIHNNNNTSHDGNDHPTTRSMRETRSIGLSQGISEPMMMMTRAKGAIVTAESTTSNIHDRLTEAIHTNQQALKSTRGLMSASDRAHSSARAESLVKSSKGMSASDRSHSTRIPSALAVAVVGEEQVVSSTGSKHKRTVSSSSALEKPRVKLSNPEGNHQKQVSPRKSKASKEKGESLLTNNDAPGKVEQNSSRESAHARLQHQTSARTSTTKKKKASRVDSAGKRSSSVPPTKYTAKKEPSESVTGGKPRKKKSASLKPGETLQASSNRQSGRSRRSEEQRQDSRRKPQTETAWKQDERYQPHAKAREDQQERSRSYHPRSVKVEEDELGAKTWHDSSERMKQRPSSLPPGPKPVAKKDRVVGGSGNEPDGLNLNLSGIDLTSLDPSQVKSILSKKIKVTPNSVKPNNDTKDLPTKRTSKSHHGRSTERHATGSATLKDPKGLDETSERPKHSRTSGTKKKNDLDSFSEHGRSGFGQSRPQRNVREYGLQDVSDAFTSSWRDLAGSGFD